jgi:hypothetical protein
MKGVYGKGGRYRFISFLRIVVEITMRVIIRIKKIAKQRPSKNLSEFDTLSMGGTV